MCRGHRRDSSGQTSQSSRELNHSTIYVQHALAYCLCAFGCFPPWTLWNITNISQHKNNNSSLSILINSWRSLSIYFSCCVFKWTIVVKICVKFTWNTFETTAVHWPFKHLNVKVEDILYSPTIIDHSRSFSISFFICNLSTFTAWKATTLILFSFFTLSLPLYLHIFSFPVLYFLNFFPSPPQSLIFSFFSPLFSIDE